MKGFSNPSNPFSFEGNDAFERCSFLNVCDSWPESPRWPITVTVITNTSRENQTPQDTNNYFKEKPNISRQKQLLDGKTNRLTAEPKAHGKPKYLTAKPNTSRQKQLLHGKPKYFTANPNTSQQNQYPRVNPNTSRYNPNPRQKKNTCGKTKRLTEEVKCSLEEQNRKKISYQRLLDTNCVRERCSFRIAIGIVFYHDVSFVLPRRSHNFPQRPSFTDW